MIEEIKTAISNDSLVIFVGAGMSMPLDFPSWTGLIQNILKNIEDDGPFNFSYHFKQGNNINVFDTLNELEHHNYNSKVKSSLYDEINSIKIDVPKLNRHKKLWEISNKIITTNYDKVLDKVKPDDIVVFSNGNEFQQSQSIKGKPFLYKIHGDITNPDSCILFESDYKKLYEEDTSDLQTLKNFLLTKTILFIGFSLKDPYVVKQMEYIRNLYNGYNKEHYVLQTQKEDFSKYNVQTIPIKDWNDDFDRLLEELIETKKQSSQIISKYIGEEENVDISKITDMVVLEKMLEEKKQEFDSADENEKRRFSKEMHSISDRMQELFAQKLEINFSQELPKHKEGELEQLFDTIFQSEKLSSQTVKKIEKIRDQHSKSYQWHQRSVLVSALACSIINHKKVDPRKIDLLVDFTNDSENRVWQKAISYLFLTLNHLGNKWLKFGNLKPKLETLKTNPKIQKALSTIIVSLQINAQNVSPINEKVFENDHFRNNPFNYFTPFYKDNPFIEKVYEDDSLEDVEDYIDFLYDIPLPDSFKYLLCNSEIKKEDKKPASESEKRFINYALNVHAVLEPYLNYINEILNFYQNFPNVAKEINQKTTIVKFKNFKNHLLNAIEHHRALARQFMIQNDFGKAKQHYRDLLKLDEKDSDAMFNLANCLAQNSKEKEYDEHLNLRLKIANLVDDNADNFYQIGRLYSEKGKQNKAIKYFDKAINCDNKNASFFNARGISKRHLKDFQSSIEDYNKAIELDGDFVGYYHNRGIAKYELENYKDAHSDFEIAISKGTDNYESYKARAFCRESLLDFKGALVDYDKALELDNSNKDVLNSKANLLRKIKRTDEAHRIIDRIISNDKNGVYLGTKAAIYSSQGHDDKFYEYLEKSFMKNSKVKWLEKDVKEKYKNEDRFILLLKKYNQTLD